MKRILFFGYTDFAGRMRASSLSYELTNRGYECWQIEQPHWCMQIKEIVSSPEEKAFTSLPDDRRLAEPFILFCGMSGEVLDTALAICKGNTRAVLTMANSRMTAYELAEHLAEEKRSFNENKKTERK